MLQIPRVLRPSQIDEILSSLPKGLEETYDRLLERVDPDDVPEVGLALKWLSLAKRPLYIEEVIEASILDVDNAVILDSDRRMTAAQLLSCLTGLVTIEPPLSGGSATQAGKHVLALAHSSIRKHLITKPTQSPRNMLFQFNKETTDEFIAKCCVEYFSHCAFVSWKNYPLARYSNRFWDQHANHNPQLSAYLHKKINDIVAPVLYPEGDASGRLLEGFPEYIEDDFANDFYDPSPQFLGSADNAIPPSLDTDIYKPVDFPASFRLLLLLPSRHWDEPLECILQTVTLDDTPHYIALSYVWGNPGDPCRIVVNGAALRITSDLEFALRHLRRRSGGGPRTIWVDQLCIDQNNYAERNHQVSIMTSIFSTASKVLVWLGPSTASSEHAMNYLAKFQDIPPLAESARNFLTSMSQDTWLAIQELLQRRWFHRGWVIQEMVVARDVEVMCGRQCFPWSVFELIETAYAAHGFDIHAETSSFRRPQSEDQHATLWQRMTGATNAEPAYPVPVDRAGFSHFVLGSGALNIMLAIRRQYKEGRPSNFLQLLIATRFYSCTDPRDKIFSFVGFLASEDIANAPLIDYSQSLAVTCIAWCTYWLLQSRKLDLLSYVDTSHNGGDDLPSWVVRVESLSQPLDQSEWIQPFYTVPSRLYTATSASIAQPVFSGGNLTLSGFAIGAVNVLGKRGLDAVPKWKKLMATPAIANAYGNTSTQKLNEIFWRTVLADQERRPFGQAQRLGEIRFENSDIDSLLKDLRDGEFSYLQARTFFISLEGLVGLCPWHTRPGDRIVLLRGGRLPFILRNMYGGRYRLIGEA
jgi:hypothetical protein